MVILFTGISGIECSSVLTKFINENRAYRYPNKKPILIKLENVIENIFFELNPTEERNKLSWVQLVLQKPYSLLKNYWVKACERIVIEVDSKIAEDPDCIIFISLHACYFHVKTQEYISLVDIELINKLKPSKIITLIDDIYEIYHRLTKRGGLYNLMQNVTKSEVIFRHIRLLDWRAKETMMSRFVADQIKSGDRVRSCEHYVLAIKHSFDTLTSLIKGGLLTAYLSHPISEVRRLERSGNDITVIRKEIADISECLSIGFTTFLPTTIDEYRIVSDELEIDGNKVLKYKSALRSRWDHPRYENPQRLLYQPCEFPQDSQLWDIGEMESTEDLSQLLSTLASLIGIQVTTRDYALVEQSKVLIIYRPLFNGNLASGVQKEYNYYKLLQAARQEDSICYIYCPQVDIDKYYINEFNERIRYYLAKQSDGLRQKNGVEKFSHLSDSECEKLVHIGENKNKVLDFLTEFLNNHGMFIGVSTGFKPLNDVEVQVQEEFLENFVNGLLKNYAKITDYKTNSSHFETGILTADQLYDNIIKTVNSIKNGKGN